jgi:membrane fusion protein, multidrug efflux system
MLRQGRLRIAAGVTLVAILVIGIWVWVTSGRESTDDAQVDGHVTQIAARVGGTVLRVPVNDNQEVAAGGVLVELDPRDYQVAVEKARAELADAQASAAAAQTSVPMTSTTTASGVSTARGSIDQARSGTDAAQKELDAARARLATAQARQREADANVSKTTRDLARLRGLLSKDEVSQQQFDAAAAAADVAKAAADAARSQVAESEAGIRVAESRVMQARVGEAQAQAALRSAETAPEQVAAMRARAAGAEARVQLARATLSQAELNLEYTVVKVPQRGIVSRKSVEVGQVVQAGQPLMAVIPLDDVWVTANFKETQLTSMHPGQRGAVTVDAYGGREFQGRVDSIAAATGARFSLLPPENATGNYVKVVQRVPVKLVLDGGQDVGHLLRPGMSVVATVYTK